MRGKSVYPKILRSIFLSNKLLENWQHQKWSGFLELIFPTSIMLTLTWNLIARMPKRRKTVEAVVGRRLCKKTSANYDCKITVLTDRIRSHQNNEISRFVDTEKDSLILLIPTAVILEFFLNM